MTTRISQRRREEKLNWKIEIFLCLRSLHSSSLYGGSAVSLAHADDNFRLSPHFTYLSRSVCRCLNTQTMTMSFSPAPATTDNSEISTIGISALETQIERSCVWKEIKSRKSSEKKRKNVVQPSLVLPTRCSSRSGVDILRRNTQREQVIWFLANILFCYWQHFHHALALYFRHSDN